MRLIARYSWPRNISQLREALVHAVRRRPVGEIQATDLPGYRQTVARHTLTPLEGGPKRDVIVAALQESGATGWRQQPIWACRGPVSTGKLKTYGITV